jgi:hydroxyacylglutathione hydrolase
MFIRQLEDESLAQYAYLIGCQQTGEAIVVDPERDVDRYLDLAARHGLRLTAVAETHIHADFLSGARELASQLSGVRIFLSDEGGDEWKYRWPADDRVAVTWLRNGDTLRVGRFQLRAWHAPGHTPEHLAFIVVDEGAGASAPMAMLSGDFVFVGDLGRPDLLESAAGIAGMMEPSARQLHASTRRFLELPDFVQVWPGHGAGSACGKALGAVPVTTVGYERRFSPAIAASAAGEESFVRFILSDQPEPPLYFARMKRLNKDGPPVLGRIPQPPRVPLEAIAAFASRPEVQVVDTTIDRRAFMAGHFPGAFLAPLDRSFPTVAGSFLDPELPIVLLAEEETVDSAVRQLIRIGYDRIEGWTRRPAAVELALAGIVPAAIESIEFRHLRARASGAGAVLDVRSGSEYAAGHIPGALNLAHTRLRSRVDDLPRDGMIYVHCASGARAAVSAAFLARLGLKAVHVEGSFAEWSSRSRD